MSVHHTPGPWTGFLDERDGHPAWLIGRGNARPILAEVAADVECGLTGAVVEANARLVAAAPELLDRLKSALRVIERANPQMDPEDVTAYTAAAVLIAKVEGRTP